MSQAGVEVGVQVNVCVDAAPSMDLNQAIDQIRLHYETMTEKNRQELESWYESKVKLKPQMHLFLSKFIIMINYYFGGIVPCLITIKTEYLYFYSTTIPRK